MGTTRTGSAFLRRALEADARQEIEAAVKVGVLMATGHNQREVGERLDLSPEQVRSAMERLRRVSPGFDGYGGGT